ncbi:N-acetylmuramoyl-L-alanine amidase [Neobacillus piezotolerans]|uniref:N-acetylmuramoyl-L-alanine amidase n=1 Tax=Neobacillus piezotolerans TaxID=2259171 RepID=A0A3D8GLZ3_9BACI|nr:SH3 domain-containing protein [Neobacillus piezotolerans]RDU35086.1 N-acetylmuramoyl-L-alanine amidase [Neobacillus piezotolerans]
MEKRIYLLLACCILLIGTLFPLKEASAGQTAAAAVDNLNIRSGPGLSYKVVDTVKKGARFTVLGQSDEWVQLQLPSGGTGWAAEWLLTMKSDNVSAASSVDNLRIRKGPGTGYGIVGYLVKGQAAEVLEKSGEWARIASKSGNGWVSAQFLQVAGKAESPVKEQNGETQNNPLQVKTVNADFLNVRSEPSLSSELIGKLANGAKVEVISEGNGWALITFSGKKGWVSSEFLSSQPGDAPPAEQKPSGVLGTVTATALSVRSEGSLSGKIISTVNKGKTFIILEEVNNWAKIEFSPGKIGWVAGWYLEKAAEGNTPAPQEVKESWAAILYDGTNIRQKPSLDSKVVARANKGSEFKIKNISGSWYEIELKGGQSGYIAGWIVEVSGTVPQINKSGGEAHLKNKVIVIDPGHGGIDNGTTGVRGTFEKGLTLKTAALVSNKLAAKGAKVIMTRDRDTYLSLPSRVGTAHYHGADAFISIHYDSNYDRSVRGMTTYYYHSYQKGLAGALQASASSSTKSYSRGARFGDYHVIRENKQAAALIELGYLSNAEEEMAVLSNQFQEAASTGIVDGLARYFKEK